MAGIKRSALGGLARQRSRVYSLLSRIYGSEPTQEFLEGLRNPQLSEALAAIGLEFRQDFENRILEELADELAVEYARLFIGPGKHIYPYESAYNCGKAGPHSDAGTRVKNIIESLGLQYRADFRDNPDHISVELELMARIAAEEAGAWDKDEFKKAAAFLELEERFVNEHLIKWVPEFAEKVIEAAVLSFYRETAELTREYIIFEKREIRRLVNQTKEVLGNGGRENPYC